MRTLFTMGSIALQSKDHRDLLDVIDKIRSEGVGRYVDLPEIIVCGDQSAGKSSVLEAISGMSFPAKDSLCTRFATELVLRRDAVPGVKIAINPGPERTKTEKERLSRFHSDLEIDIDVNNPDLGKVIEKAKDAMGLGTAKVFSTDVLRVELKGPKQPHLTLVDLPGLFRAGNRDQSVDDAATVGAMVRGYMERPRSIILAVVSANYDFALQEVTRLAAELDKDNTRTFGLITKPDDLKPTSTSEANYIKLARNKDVRLRLGWHVLKNRDFDMVKRGATSAERDEAEEKFFATGAWASVDRGIVGVKALKPRLSEILRDQILAQLPGLLNDVNSGIEDCKNRLTELGTPLPTVKDQRRYLLRVSKEFSDLMKGAVDGIYIDPFFGDAKTDDGYAKRVRAVVQNQLTDFRKRLQSEGGTLSILDSVPSPQATPPLPPQATHPFVMSRSDYMEEVRALMGRSRGCELPGMLNPRIIGEMFTRQCQPWRGIAERAKDLIMHAVTEAAALMVDHISTNDTADTISDVMSDALHDLKRDLERKISELVDPYYKGHPITYNDELVTTVRNARATRHGKSRVQSILESHFGLDRLDTYSDNRHRNYNFNPVSLLEELTNIVTLGPLDMEDSAVELAVDYMQAYYKIALKKFTDDISVLAIENTLIRKLPTMFSPEMVFDLTDEEVAAIAADNAETAAERARCTEKLAVLEAGLCDLKRLNKHRPWTTGFLSLPTSLTDHADDSTVDGIPVEDDVQVVTVSPRSDPTVEQVADFPEKKTTKKDKKKAKALRQAENFI